MIKTMSIPDFIRYGWQEESKVDVFFAHLKRHKIKYRIIGTAIILFLGVSSVAFASTGIDAGAEKIYRKLINIGKWVIICKGGIETIKSAADGDFEQVKRGFLGYGVTYAILWGLPWMMEEIEKLFEDMGT